MDAGSYDGRCSETEEASTSGIARCIRRAALAATPLATAAVRAEQSAAAAAARLLLALLVALVHLLRRGVCGAARGVCFGAAAETTHRPRISGTVAAQAPEGRRRLFADRAERMALEAGSAAAAATGADATEVERS